MGVGVLNISWLTYKQPNSCCVKLQESQQYFTGDSRGPWVLDCIVLQAPKIRLFGKLQASHLFVWKSYKMEQAGFSLSCWECSSGYAIRTK